MSKITNKVSMSLKEIRQQTNNLESISGMVTNLLQDLLDFAQIEKNTFQVNNSTFNLIDAVNQAFQIVKPTADLKQVTFKL